MDEINKYRKLKLKRIRLSEIILKNKLKSDTDSYNIKTERPIIKSRDKFIINNKSPYLNTLNTTYLYKKNIPILNLKYKSPQRKRNLPDINKIIKNKNEKKGKSIGANRGYNNYMKEKAHKIYQRIKRLLLEEKLNQLSVPKYRLKINKEFIKSKKSKDNKYKNTIDNNNFIQLSPTYKYKKHLNYNQLTEKERIESRNLYNTILKINYKKLESCETKFNSVIDKTMKLLFEYQHSFDNSKDENKNEFK